jgi:group I intron endonuclease
MEKISGIYKIVNKTNGKYYVGSSRNIKLRWKQHRDRLANNRHENDYLQHSWNKYGPSHFDFFMIENALPNELLITEQKYLNVAEKEKDKCYNLSFLANTIGFTPEIRKKISLSLVGNSRNKGKKLNDEARKSRSEKLKSYHQKVGPTKNPAYDNTHYHFFSKKTGEEFTGTPYEMAIKFSLDRSSVLNSNEEFCLNIRAGPLFADFHNRLLIHSYRRISVVKYKVNKATYRFLYSLNFYYLPTLKCFIGGLLKAMVNKICCCCF